MAVFKTILVAIGFVMASVGGALGLKQANEKQPIVPVVSIAPLPSVAPLSSNFSPLPVEEKKCVYANEEKMRELNFWGLPASPSGKWCRVKGGRCKAVWCEGYYGDQSLRENSSVVYSCNHHKPGNVEQTLCKKVDN